MPETLSVERLSPSERAQIGSRDVFGAFGTIPAQNVTEPVRGYSLPATGVLGSGQTIFVAADIDPCMVMANLATGAFGSAIFTSATGKTTTLTDKIAYGFATNAAAQNAPTFQGRITGPVRSLFAIFDRWQISDQDAALLLGVDGVSFIKDLRVGTAGLTSRDMQDRARLLIRIYEGVHSLLREPAAERSWINAAMPALNNRTVLDTMRGGSISNLLLVEAFVDHANGR